MKSSKLNLRLINLMCIVIFILISPGCSSVNKTVKKNTGIEIHIDKYKLSFKTENPFVPEQMPYKSTSYKAKVMPYSVNEDLSNIVNRAQFGSFTPAQQKLLSKNGFCVVGTKDEQLFYTYENNTYLKIPSFITGDSILQLYNVFFDYSLRSLESNSLADKLTKLTDSLLYKQILLYNQIKNTRVREAALNNIAYFEVAHQLLKKVPSKELPEEAKRLAEQELMLIKAGGSFKTSPIFKTLIDYSQYVPRGHYTRDEGLKNYFKAMMWYGQAPFELFEDDSKERVLKLNTTLQAMLITYSLYYNNSRQSDIDLWEDIYNPTEFYVGKADDLNVYNYKAMLIKAFGEKVNLEKLTDTDIIKILTTEGRNLPKPQIVPDWGGKGIAVNKQFRFMGQRYIPDSEILQKLSDRNYRVFPKGMDVMGVLGSDRAKDILLNQYKESEKWNKYTSKFTKLRNKFSTLRDDVWKSNMYYGWLWTLNPIIETFKNGFPQFMLNKAWEDKSLNTALGSWSELRHDTILYAKQSGAECGGDELPPSIKSYVEPNVKFYDRLLWLTKYSEKNLSARKILNPDMSDKLKSLEDLLTFMINCSVKELRNQELTQNEYNQLYIYGGTLEYLSASFSVGNGRWFEITSEADRNMSVIADVHTGGMGYLEEGVGPAAQIYVIVPIGKKLYLTRGAVFQYYEFISSQRLKDEDWQKMLRQNKAPKQPIWTNTYKSGEDKKVPQPKKTYSSGC